MPKLRWSFFLPARDHSFIKIFTLLSYSWLTPYGMILTTTLFISIGIASPGLHISAYLFTSILLAFMLSAILFSVFFIPEVTVSRKLLSIPHTGDYLIYEAIIKNISGKPLKGLSVTEGYLPYGLYYSFDHPKFNNYVSYLEPGKSATVTLVMYCAQRGIYTLPRLLIGSSYPSNIIRWPIKCGIKEPLVVFPFYISQTQFDIPLNSIYQPGGITITSTLGESNEFLSTREYRHGDRLKDIHWPSYARTGKLIVKEYINEYYTRTAIFIDTQFAPKDKPINLEQRISYAAGIADALSNRGYLIDLLMAGENLYEFKKGNPATYLDQILNILSSLEGLKTTDFKTVEAKLMNQASTLSSLVMILRDWDEPRARLCRTLKRIGLNLRIIIARDAPLREIPDLDVTLVPTNDKKHLIP
ncbi:MAG: DUF58 domain-containing protein [Candidatus Omnitrophota bacterium]